MSLKRITLRDFVIVRELDLDLSAGFSVLTGETGAGKSILIDALQLALGARAEAGWCAKAQAARTLQPSSTRPPALTRWLEDAGFERRRHPAAAPHRGHPGQEPRLDQRQPATAAQLRELGEQLVDIHGQHAWQSLTRP
jgi:DNA repair protein RecN (Recombination protein N)